MPQNVVEVFVRATPVGFAGDLCELTKYTFVTFVFTDMRSSIHIGYRIVDHACLKITDGSYMDNR